MHWLLTLYNCPPAFHPGCLSGVAWVGVHEVLAPGAEAPDAAAGMLEAAEQQVHGEAVRRAAHADGREA